MKTTMRTLALSILCGLMLLGSPGCFGKSTLTTGVVKWHSELDWDKWPKEILYVPMFFLVLPVTSLVDAFVLNAIDFWTKDDPLSASLEAEPQAPDSQVKVAAK